MLEFLGFIALLAIIFGVSLGTALSGFIKFVAIGFAILVAIAVIAKLLESKKGSTFVLVTSIIAISLGIYMINDPVYSQRIDSCDPLLNDVSLHVDCMVNAFDRHNESINKGWGYVIVGGITGFCSMVSLGDKLDDKKTTSKHVRR